MTNFVLLADLPSGMRLRDGDNLIVSPGVTVSASYSSPSIQAEGDNFILVSDGAAVVADDFDATISLIAGESVLLNRGEIKGFGLGVGDYDGNNIIINNGSIIGELQGVFIQTGSLLVNRGDIHLGFRYYDGETAVTCFDATTMNSGTIRGTFSLSGGILINYGEISSNGTTVVSYFSGDCIVLNPGLISGDVELSESDDLYSGVYGNVVGAIDGAAGNDLLIGGKHSDEIGGGADDDGLFGLSGADTLTGGSGDDWLKGGIGQDEFALGAGSDTDTIVDFQNNRDSIVLARDVLQAGLDIEVSGGDLVLTFETGDQLVIADTTNVVSLLNDVVLV